MAGVLLSVLALLVIYNVRRAASRARRQSEVISSVIPAVPTEGSVPVETPSTPGEVTLSVLKEKAKELKWGRDPFFLEMAMGGDLPTLQLSLSGIIFDEVHPEATYAIINEEVVRIGDNIRGIKVIDIQPDYVILKKFNQEFTLYLYEGTE